MMARLSACTPDTSVVVIGQIMSVTTQTPIPFQDAKDTFMHFGSYKYISALLSMFPHSKLHHTSAKHQRKCVSCSCVPSAAEAWRMERVSSCVSSLG